MLDIIPSNRFKKDLKLIKKRGYKIDALRTVINTLAAEEKLDGKYYDHALTGDLIGFRECHIEPNWLLIYRVEQNELALFLIRTGTHSDLF